MTSHELLALNGSPSSHSKTHALAALAVSLCGGGTVIDLGDLDAEGLLGQRVSPDVQDAIAAVSDARLIFLATPIFRATYSGLLKVFFDLLPPTALEGTACILGATGGLSAHLLAIDHGLRPMVASLGGNSAATSVYLTADDFSDEGGLRETSEGALRDALEEGLALADMLSSVETSSPATRSD